MKTGFDLFSSNLYSTAKKPDFVQMVSGVYDTIADDGDGYGSLSVDTRTAASIYTSKYTKNWCIISINMTIFIDEKEKKKMATIHQII